jgi:hypothetical protein
MAAARKWPRHWTSVLSWQDEKQNFSLQRQGDVTTTLQVP